MPTFKVRDLIFKLPDDAQAQLNPQIHTTIITTTWCNPCTNRIISYCLDFSYLTCGHFVSHVTTCGYHISHITCGILSNCGISIRTCGPTWIDPTTPYQTIQTATVVQQPGAINSAEALTALKAQLQQAMVEVEQQEAELAPQTLEQVDMLEKQLNESLAELRARREQLKKSPKK